LKQLQVVRAKANKLYKSLEMLFSVDGGPLTDNVVFASVQRLLAHEAELASPKARLAARSATGKTRCSFRSKDLFFVFGQAQKNQEQDAELASARYMWS